MDEATVRIVRNFLCGASSSVRESGYGVLQKQMGDEGA